MDKNNVNAILNFIASCNDFIGGKFLFAPAKLQSMYDEILLSPDLNNLFGECNKDFNYSLEMTKAFVKMPTKLGSFTKPAELDKFLALVFGVLKEIKEETLDYNIFVGKYFSAEDKIPPTKKFAQNVVVPLRDTVAKYFELDEHNKTRFALTEFVEEKPEEIIEPEAEKVEEEPKIDLAPIFERIKDICSNMLTIVKQTQKLNSDVKSDAVFVLSEIINACEAGDIEKAYALVVGFRYLAKNIKTIKYQMNALEMVLIELENI